LTPIGLTVRAGLSLNARLLIAASVVLTAFLGLTGLTLDRAFRDSALAHVRAALPGSRRMQSRRWAGAACGADPKIGGHGIGPAVVREIVEGVYGGRLEFGRGALGGALVRVWL